MNHSTTPLTQTSRTDDPSSGISQDLINMENQGFYGFESMEEVSAYRDCISTNTFVESVVTVKARNFGGPVLAVANEMMELMSIPSKTRGLVWCALPQNSPHAKDFKAFYARKSEGGGGNGQTHPQSFTQWWLGEGGKFHVTGGARNTSGALSNPTQYQFVNESIRMAENTSGVLTNPQNQLGNYSTGNQNQFGNYSIGMAENTAGVLTNPQNQFGNYSIGNYGDLSVAGGTSEAPGAGASQFEPQNQFGNFTLGNYGEFVVGNTSEAPGVDASQFEPQNQIEDYSLGNYEEFVVDNTSEAPVADASQFEVQNQIGDYSLGNHGEFVVDGTSEVLGTGASADTTTKERKRPNVINTMIPQAAGARRIWKEMSENLPIHQLVPKWPAHPVHSRAPPATVDLRLLGDVYVTAYELLAYFPCHAQRWQDHIMRFNGAGWGPTEMFKLAYIIRGQITNVMTDKVSKLIRAEGSMHARAYGFMRDSTPNPFATNRPYQDLTCANWVPPVRDRSIQSTFGQDAEFLSDYYVSDLVDGIMPHLMPIGQNAGPLTAVVRWTLDHPAECKGLKLSNVSEMSKQMGVFKTSFDAGLATSGAAHADVESLQACREALGN